MKLKIRHFILLGLLVPFVFISCKTTGTPPDSLVDGGVTEDLDGPVEETDLAALAAARAKTEESRSLAKYVEGPSYFPGEWGFAEDRYSTAAGRIDAPETKKETYSRVAEWKGIGAAYDDIYNKSVPQFAGRQQELLAAARAAAVQAGADKLVPDRLAQADVLSASANQKAEAGEFAASVKDGKEAGDRYKILQTIAEAHTKQEEADKYDFFSSDPDNYMLAADAGNDAVSFYDEGNLIKAQDSADEALARFNQVIKNGWVSRVEEKASIAREWRQYAQDVKANVAVRPDFDAAERVYNQAHTALRAEDYSAAIDLFGRSEALFVTAHDKAVAKRDNAEKALRQAEEKLAESEAKAQSAEEIIGGGE
jgi:hypothetical protein